MAPRWKRCTQATDDALGEAVGQDWVKKYFSPEKKENMLELVSALEAALRQDIEQLPWMSDDTKKKALEKLALIRNKIGYPEHWRDYSTLEVKRDDLLGNIARAGIFEDRRNLNKLGKPVDETEWGMTPPTVNAYYSPPMNDINFPAGILQPPFYDFSKDAAVNFGGIGVVIGHEMTHGFDDQGSKYDGHGNVVEWQTPADRKAFTRAHRLRGEGVWKLRGRARAKAERPTDPGREHCRQWRPSPRLHGADGYLGQGSSAAARSMATHRRSGSSWPSARCGARTYASKRRGTSALTDPHSPGRLAGERRGAKFRRVRQGVQLQEGRSHVSGEPLAGCGDPHGTGEPL